MELEKNTIKNLIDYLVKHRYPKDSFTLEYNLGKNCFVDLAVIDQELNIPILLFEVKSRKTESSIRLGNRQLEQDLAYLEDKSTPAYLVFPKAVEPFFDLQRVNSPLSEIGSNPIGNPEDILGDFDYYRNTGISQKKNEKQEKQEKTVETFSYVCWILAVVLVIFALLVNFGKIVINQNAGLMFLLAIMLILAPFVQSIKILGFEINQFDKATKKKDNHN
ncbi:hypothetical protein [uncultured Sphaerochaeta sp.]|uniref:hypothetical protein n=1 Tax=uncultured Sphaerochaeta sp. TaxID=886478 RepID=UPI002A0A994A|nr:hypothetical protein [uncultured Sphaerochaeta sp.]